MVVGSRWVRRRHCRSRAFQTSTSNHYRACIFVNERIRRKAAAPAPGCGGCEASQLSTRSRHPCDVIRLTYTHRRRERAVDNDVGQTAKTRDRRLVSSRTGYRICIWMCADETTREQTVCGGGATTVSCCHANGRALAASCTVDCISDATTPQSCWTLRGAWRPPTYTLLAAAHATRLPGKDRSLGQWKHISQPPAARQVIITYDANPPQFHIFRAVRTVLMENRKKASPSWSKNIHMWLL